MAPSELFGGHPASVGEGTVNDPVHRTSHQVDVAVTGLDDDDRPRLLALGEAEWNETIGLAHVERLRRVRALLTAEGRPRPGTAKPPSSSAPAFTPTPAPPPA